jgi:hypothetical protein
MSKILGGFLSVGLGLLLGAAEIAAAPADQVTKDHNGRVISRTTKNADRSSHRTSVMYRSDAEYPKVVLDEDFDPLGRPTKRVRQRFDGQGRLREKVEVTIDAQGEERGTQTEYQYDPSGRRREEAKPVN